MRIVFNFNPNSPICQARILLFTLQGSATRRPFDASASLEIHLFLFRPCRIMPFLLEAYPPCRLRRQRCVESPHPTRDIEKLNSREKRRIRAITTQSRLHRAGSFYTREPMLKFARRKYSGFLILQPCRGGYHPPAVYATACGYLLCRGRRLDDPLKL